MINLFLIKLILSFIIGGVWITLVTVIAEKFGTKKGGIIAMLPSTSLIALLFIAFTQTPTIASQSTTVFPLVNGVDVIFIVVYAALVQTNFFLAVFSSLAVWFLSLMLIIHFNFNNFSWSLVGYVFLFLVGYYIFEKWLDIKSEGEKKVKYSYMQLLIRGLVGGLIITFAVIMAKEGGPVFGGAFACFPAVIISTMFITYFSYGSSFSSATMKAMLLNSISVTVFAIAIRYTYLSIGVILGTFVSFLVSLIISYFVYLFAEKKMS